VCRWRPGSRSSYGRSRSLSSTVSRGRLPWSFRPAPNAWLAGSGCELGSRSGAGRSGSAGMATREREAQRNRGGAAPEIDCHPRKADGGARNGPVGPRPLGATGLARRPGRKDASRCVARLQATFRGGLRPLLGRAVVADGVGWRGGLSPGRGAIDPHHCGAVQQLKVYVSDADARPHPASAAGVTCMCR
jgi:hypothetical protein